MSPVMRGQRAKWSNSVSLRGMTLRELDEVTLHLEASRLCILSNLVFP